MKFSIDVFSN
jgi:hypothetical protein